jgi:hypothetical protein
MQTCCRFHWRPNTGSSPSASNSPSPLFPAQDLPLPFGHELSSPSLLLVLNPLMTHVRMKASYPYPLLWPCQIFFFLLDTTLYIFPFPSSSKLFLIRQDPTPASYSIATHVAQEFMYSPISSSPAPTIHVSLPPHVTLPEKSHCHEKAVPDFVSSLVYAPNLPTTFPTAESCIEPPIVGIAHEWNESMGERCADELVVAVKVGKFCTIICFVISIFALYDYCVTLPLLLLG